MSRSYSMDPDYSKVSHAEAHARLYAASEDRREKRSRGLSMAECAFAVWPGRRFGSRQGAALAVSRLVRKLVDAGLAWQRYTEDGYWFAAPPQEATRG
jgi:hypothetical protein